MGNSVQAFPGQRMSSTSFWQLALIPGRCHKKRKHRLIPIVNIDKMLSKILRVESNSLYTVWYTEVMFENVELDW